VTNTERIEELERRLATAEWQIVAARIPQCQSCHHPLQFHQRVILGVLVIECQIRGCECSAVPA
jgi:hypothetical protein